MKRSVSLVVVIALCVLFMSSAFASTVEFTYDGSGSSFVKWSETTTSVGTDWKVSSWETSNLCPTRTVDVKIYHAPGVYASHTFTYDHTSTDWNVDMFGNLTINLNVIY